MLATLRITNSSPGRHRRSTRGHAAVAAADDQDFGRLAGGQILEAPALLGEAAGQERAVAFGQGLGNIVSPLEWAACCCDCEIRVVPVQNGRDLGDSPGQKVCDDTGQPRRLDPLLRRREFGQAPPARTEHRCPPSRPAGSCRPGRRAGGRGSSAPGRRGGRGTGGRAHRRRRPAGRWSRVAPADLLGSSRAQAVTWSSPGSRPPPGMNQNRSGAPSGPFACSEA